MLTRRSACVHREAAEEIKRLKAQSDSSYRMVRQLKAQVSEQAEPWATY